MQKQLYFFLCLKHFHHLEQLFELNLTDDSILIIIHRLVQVSEFDQESLMFLQLEVENDLLEVFVL